MSSFKIVVLSDLHAAPKPVGGSSGDVKLFTDQDESNPLSNPLCALIKYFEEQSVSADLVICPGYMTNKADAQALRYVWEKLHLLRDKLGATALLATVGNHDVDSRSRGDDIFPRETLMRLAPPFPSGDVVNSNHYWAHGYYLTEIGDIRILVLNSCWLHESRDDLERGAITSYTLDKLKQELVGSSKKVINIAICHHHPLAHSDLGLGTDDVMRNGQQFLDMLSDNGNWLVLHGHKHHPKIEYAQGQIKQPIVFASGSFSGRLEGDNANVSRNYVHIIEFVEPGKRLVGRVQSLQWVPGLGWARYSDKTSGFPTEFGFGYKADLPELAEKVRAYVGCEAFVKWGDLAESVPEVNFIMPKELAYLIEILDSSHKFKTVYDVDGLPSQIGPEL